MLDWPIFDALVSIGPDSQLLFHFVCLCKQVNKSIQAGAEQVVSSVTMKDFCIEKSGIMLDIFNHLVKNVTQKF